MICGENRTTGSLRNVGRKALCHRVVCRLKDLEGPTSRGQLAILLETSNPAAVADDERCEAQDFTFCMPCAGGLTGILWQKKVGIKTVDAVDAPFDAPPKHAF